MDPCIHRFLFHLCRSADEKNIFKDSANFIFILPTIPPSVKRLSEGDCISSPVGSLRTTCKTEAIKHLNDTNTYQLLTLDGNPAHHSNSLILTYQS